MVSAASLTGYLPRILLPDIISLSKLLSPLSATCLTVRVRQMEDGLAGILSVSTGTRSVYLPSSSFRSDHVSAPYKKIEKIKLRTICSCDGVTFQYPMYPTRFTCYHSYFSLEASAVAGNGCQADKLSRRTTLDLEYLHRRECPEARQLIDSVQGESELVIGMGKGRDIISRGLNPGPLFGLI